MDNGSGPETLKRIREALDSASKALVPFLAGSLEAKPKSSGYGPVTEADRTVDRVLREVLLREGEGWLSEESVDDLRRLEKSRVWVVDPLDGTMEFLAGVPEWCVSVAMVENGRPVAGGVCNPVTGEVFLGSVSEGVTYNDRPVQATKRECLNGAVILASRSEFKRGEWERFEKAPFVIRPMGSVAYKLALVAGGMADATWTLSPKNEWDIAAGVALVEAAGGFAQGLEGLSLSFNSKSVLVSGLLAGGLAMRPELTAFLGRHASLKSA
jgi:myo-inositol-1(or 4)-monophosphatase